MTRGIYAADTDVSPEKSLLELRQVLGRYGGEEGFGYLDLPEGEVVAWRMGGRPFRFPIPRPQREHYTHGPNGKPRTPAQIQSAVDQARRQRWRAVVLIVKAALEGSEALGVPVDTALLPYLVLSDGRTVAEAAPDLTTVSGHGWAALLEGKK